VPALERIPLPVIMMKPLVVNVPVLFRLPPAKVMSPVTVNEPELVRFPALSKAMLLTVSIFAGIGKSTHSTDVYSRTKGFFGYSARIGKDTAIEGDEVGFQC